MLARLAVVLTEAGVFNDVPFRARRQMHAAGIAALSTQTAVRFEVNRLLRALGGIEVPLLLMKGCAYVHAGLPAARGRFIGDVDLMVPRARIDEVEQRLLASGWATGTLDDYDQHYYRAWTHEIPPLQHRERDTPVDLHHTIAPLTSRVHPDAAAILAAAVPLADPRLQVMCPADMVLHSAVHLFNDEVGMPLRDLFDQHDLLCSFGADPAFWSALLERARLHGLQRPCHYLLRYAERVPGTQIPPEVRCVGAAWGPKAPVRWLMTALFDLRFRPDPVAGVGALKSVAVFALYLRAHWLRMPPAMLVRHLWVKAWRGWREARAARRDAPPAARA